MPKVPPAYGIESHPKFTYHTSFIKEGIVVYLCTLLEKLALVTGVDRLW
jgi:hypothetical protein